MKAKEAGLGYRIEWKDVLYLVPTPQSKALKLLHDETFVNTKYGGLGDLVQFKRRVDLRGCRSVDYMGSSTAISDNAGGRIYVYFISSESTLGQSASYTARLWYMDE